MPNRRLTPPEIASMRRLYRDHGHEEQAACAAYVRAEQAGEVVRKGGISEVSAVAYAKALWKDGIAKGWLERRGRDD